MRRRTTNGGVDVDLTRIADAGRQAGVHQRRDQLRLPQDAKATITASVTNGGISTGGLNLDKSESTRRRLEARLNGGGPPVRLEGTNGGISIDGR